DRRHQGGDRRDRLRDPGAALPRDRHEGQGRHPHGPPPRPRERLVSARTKARKRALDMLYSADMRQVPVEQVLAVEAERAVSEPERQASWLYARALVDGIVDHRDEIDERSEERRVG